MVLSYQIHHLDKRNCKKKERTYQTLGWKGNQHKGPLLPGSLKIWRGKLDSNIGDDNEDDHHNANVHLLPPSARTLIPLLCRLSFSRLLLRLLTAIMIKITTVMVMTTVIVIMMMTVIVNMMMTTMMSYIFYFSHVP